MSSNELIFIGHVGLTLAAVLGALRLGRSALVAILALFGVLANLFVLKQTVLFGLTVTCSDVYMIGSMLTLNLLQEFWDKKAARQAVWIAFFGLVLLGAVSQVQLLYHPSPFDTKHAAYAALLRPAPRLVAASFVAYLISQLLDTEIFGRIKRGPLALRSASSMLISQGVDTAIFTLLGLAGLVASITNIMLMSFAIKVITIGIATPFLGLAKRMRLYEV